MTIEESIKELESARESIEPYLFIDEALDQSMKTAIEIMRKYRMIVETYKLWNEVNDMSYNRTMLRIGVIIAEDDALSLEQYKQLLNSVFGIRTAQESEVNNDNQS